MTAGTCRAQEEFSRFEAGAQLTAFHVQGNDGSPAFNYGFGGRFDFNLTRRVALEAQLDYYPGSVMPLIQAQGGKTTQGLFGVRAKMLQSKHFSVYGLLRPGFLRFSNAGLYTGTPPDFFRLAPATYFTLNLGGGIEYYPSPRLILRADLTGNPYRLPNQTVTFANGGGAPASFFPGRIEDTFRFSLGVGYRLGTLHETEREKTVPGRFELGAQFTALTIERLPFGAGVRTEPGVGGYVSYRFYRVFYADGSLTFYPRGTAASQVHDGGTIFQGLFGLKGGIRRDHFGIFGKVRPGFQSYSRALTGFIQAPPTAPAVDGFTYNPATAFALDLGGIVEIYPGKHGTLRFDAGDTHVYFKTANFRNSDGTMTSVPGGQRKHTIQFSVGYGWRF